MGRCCVACILIFVWLQGKIRVGEWCCKVVGNGKVQPVARCSFLLPRNLIKTCMCVCMCVNIGGTGHNSYT